jgi:pyruvate-formate lyase-activating enzyme
MAHASLDAIRRCLEEYSMPPMIILDITNVCNLRCIHCPHADMQSRKGFKPAHLRWDHFTRVVDELADHREPCLLRFVGDGEPLLHPRLLDMVDYAKEHCGCIVNLTSNGTLLSAESVERLLRSGIDLVDISIDALTKPVYEQVRRGGSFERLMRGVFHFLDARERMSSGTKVMVSFIEQDENIREADWFRSFWEPLVDYVMVRSLHSASGLAKQDESRARNRADDRERYPCPHLWKRLTVDFLGRIKFCAHDWESGSVLGSIGETTLRSVWKGEQLEALRAGQWEGRHDVDRSICQDCSDWASSRWDWGYERLVDRVVMGKPTFLKCLPPLADD